MKKGDFVHQIESGDFILCADMQWRHKGFHEGANFTTTEVDYLLDRWTKNKKIDVAKINVIDYK